MQYYNWLFAEEIPDLNQISALQLSTNAQMGNMKSAGSSATLQMQRARDGSSENITLTKTDTLHNSSPIF
jgi:hypothetical protein